MADGTAPARPRRGAVIALIALASVIGFLAVFALWAKRQLLETQTWTDTSTKLLEDSDIRAAVADYTVDTLFTEAPVQQDIEQALPPRAARAAGPITGALRQLAHNLALRALESPRVQALWEDANREAHERLIDLVDKGGSHRGARGASPSDHPGLPR